MLVHARRGLIGVVRDIDSRVGHHFDDSRRFVEVAGLSAADLAGIQERNARTVYPGLDALLTLQEGDHPMELRSMQQLGVVHRNVHRVPRADVEALPPFGVSAIHEGMGRLGLMCPYIWPICPTARLCGAAVRAAAAGRQLDAARGNATAGTGRRRRGRAHHRARGGFFGELPGTSVRARGGVGLVIDGGGRDGAALEAMNFPSSARRSTPRARSSWAGSACPSSAPTRSSTPATWSLPTSTGWSSSPPHAAGDVAEAARRLLDAPALQAAGLKYID